MSGRFIRPTETEPTSAAAIAPPASQRIGLQPRGPASLAGTAMVTGSAGTMSARSPSAATPFFLIVIHHQLHFSFAFIFQSFAPLNFHSASWDIDARMWAHEIGRAHV